MKKIFFTIAICLVSGIRAETYNFARLDNTHGLSNNQIGCIFKDSRGFVWIGTNFGLNRYDGYRVKVYKSIKNDCTSLINNSIWRIQEDRNDNLWITGNQNYVVYDVQTEKFNRNITSYLSELGIHFNPSIVEIDKQKNYYFYKPNDGIYRSEEHTFE